MAKAPVVKAPSDARKDRRTRFASGPGPMPMPSPPTVNPPNAAPQPPAAKAPVAVPPTRKTASNVAAPAAPARPAAPAKPVAPKPKPDIKKTQMLMGAPPMPGAPPVGTPKRNTASVVDRPHVTKGTNTNDGLPSHQETAIGPAPLPPTPAPPKPATKTAPPIAPAAAAPKVQQKSPYDDIFSGEPTLKADLKDAQALNEALRDRDTMIPTSPNTPTSPVSPTSRAHHDTLPNTGGQPTLGTQPRRGLGVADTHFQLGGDDGYSEPEARASTEALPPERGERAGTQMHGTQGLSAPAAEAPKIRLTPGRNIPGTRYRIKKWLGEGGMGVVYEVEHIDIERRSALKILRFDLSQQPQMAQVFRDEARAASRLGSPNIVEVYDFGELPDGRLFFAMELLEGVDLVPANEQTTMDSARVIAIMRQVCKGLAKAHEAGVVHRDVKPENIIISDIDNRADTAKIVDFGISAMLAAGERRAGIAGTPHYMAPEQILGEDFDGRLDIYALGCTAYELMVGMPPFDADAVEEILKLQVHQPPMAPSQRRPDVEYPAELEAVIMRCLAKRPEERYANMADLEAALCEAQIAAGIVTAWDDLPVPTLPDPDRYERIVAGMPSDSYTPEKRSLLWPIVAATSTLAAAGLAAFLLFGGQPTDEDKSRVEQLINEARDSASKAAWVVPPPNLDSEETTLLKVQELEAIEGSAEELADDSAQELRDEFANTLVGHGDQLWDVARNISQQYYVWAWLFDPSNDRALERSGLDPVTLSNYRRRALAGEFSELDRMLAATAAVSVVEDEQQKAEITEALNESLEESEDISPLAMASVERDADKAGIALPKARRGAGARRRNDQPDATPEPAPAAEPDDEIVVAEPEPEPALEPEPEPEPEAAQDARVEAGKKKRRSKASASLGDSGGKRDPARSKELTQQADSKRKKGLRAEAKSLYGQAIAANPGNGEAHLGLALVHFDQGSYHKARKAAQQAVRHSPRNGRAHKTLGDAFYKEFRYEDALKAYQEAERLGQNVGRRISDMKKKLGK